MRYWNPVNMSMLETYFVFYAIPSILLEHWYLIETLILEMICLFGFALLNSLYKPEMLELWKHGDVVLKPYLSASACPSFCIQLYFVLP